MLIYATRRACIAGLGQFTLLSELGPESMFVTLFQGGRTIRWAAPELLGLQEDVHNLPNASATKCRLAGLFLFVLAPLTCSDCGIYVNRSCRGRFLTTIMRVRRKSPMQFQRESCPDVPLRMSLLTIDGASLVNVGPWLVNHAPLVMRLCNS